MTPVGHAAFSYCTGRIVSPRVAFGLTLGGVLVDIDFLLFFSPHFNALHRVVTHNLVFVVLMAVVAAAWPWLPRMIPRGVFAFSVLVGGIGHLLVDSVMDGNPSNGIGVALGWPWSRACWSPFNLVAIPNDPPTWDEPFAMGRQILTQAWIELPFVAVAGWMLLRRYFGSTRASG